MVLRLVSTWGARGEVLACLLAMGWAGIACGQGSGKGVTDGGGRGEDGAVAADARTGGNGGGTGSGGLVGSGGSSAAGRTGGVGGNGAAGGGGLTGSGGAIGQGGASGPTVTDPNVVRAFVDGGPQSIGYTNGLFVSVTLCEPGTSNCQTIDHLLVDTGSVGVRILESQLTVALPVAKDATGAPLAECTPFVDGTAWGPVKTADVQVGGEMAKALPVQTIGEQTYPIPSSCTGTPITDLQTLAANGIFGVGIYLKDCGAVCAETAASGRNPGLYYACTSTPAAGCTITAVSVNQQVSHPVAAFPVDNNGVMIQLPGVPPGGAPLRAGLLVFGIGTRANNGLGNARLVAPNAVGLVETAFPVGGARYTSFLDSGSNGVFFLDTATTNIEQCTGGLKSFYCPSTTQNLTATILGSNGADSLINFSVANAAQLPGGNFAFSDLAGPMPGFPANTGMPGFDWGLPFFFGRSVYTAIESQNTPAGIGPFFAF